MNYNDIPVKQLIDSLIALKGVLHLDLSECRSITSESYMAIWGSCPHLMSFYAPHEAKDGTFDRFHERNISVFVDYYNEEGESWVACKKKLLTNDLWTVETLNINMPPEYAEALANHLTGIKQITIYSFGNSDWICYPFTESLAHNAVELTYFNAHNIQFGQDDLKLMFQHATKLRRVFLMSCPVSDEALKALADNCPLLETLSCDDIIADTTVKLLLSKCTRLTSIDIKQYPRSPNLLPYVVDAGCLSIMSAKEYFLKKKQRRPLLNIELQTPDLGLTDYLTLFKQNPFLEEISLEDRNLNNDIISKLAAHCPLLKKIELRRYACYIDVSNLASLKNLSWVQLVDVYVGDFSFQMLFNQAKIVKLHLLQCRGYSGELFKPIIGSCPGIRELSVIGSDRIGNSDVIALLEKCRDLELLDLTGCVNVTTDIHSYIRAHGKVKVVAWCRTLGPYDEKHQDTEDD